MLGACLPDADKPSTLFFGRSPFPAWVDEVHKRIQNEAEERMPYEAFGGLVGAFVGACLAPTLDRLSASHRSAGPSCCQSCPPARDHCT